MYRAYQRVVAQTDLGRVTFHDLRHTAATLMLKTGVPMKEASERLGHTSVAFTMQVYAHVHLDGQERAASALDDLIRPA